MDLPEIWLGSEESRDQYLLNALLASQRMPEMIAQEQAFMARLEEDGESLSDYLAADLMSIEGNVGIVTISGPMEAREGWRQLWAGTVAYPTIMSAIKKHLENPQIEIVLTSWDTPGGDARGISDLGDFIQDARKVKEVYAWTGSSALSAGYWAASCCKQVRSSKMAETGSIGAVAKFRSYSRYLKDMGIDTLIARSAEMKAVLQPEEAIDDKKREYLQAKVDELHTFFVDQIKSARPALRSKPPEQWANGDTFYGEDAISMGLVDGPTITLGEMVSWLQKKVERKQQQNTGGTMNRSVMLTEETIAKLMSGIPVEPVVAQAGAPQVGEDTSASPDGETPVADSSASAPESAQQETAVAGESAQGDTGTGSGEAQPAAAETSLVGYLKEKVEALEKQSADRALELSKAQATNEALQQVESTLRPIAIKSLHWAQIALGQTPIPAEDLPTTKLVEVHQQTVKLLEERLPSGRVSVEGQEESRKASVLQADTPAERRVRAIPREKR